ncbi:MAG: flagellar basal-body rod protein FlgF [Desulfovermiculus sp.]
MPSGMYGALSGAVTVDNRMEVLSNNLANVSTPGFKQERSYFQSILDNRVQAGAGSGVNYSGMNGTETDFSQGRIEHTGRDLDLAIQGDGFFKVADENGFYYTRHGGFMRMPDGAVVNRSGQQLVGENGPIQIPDNGVHIDQDGVILGADGQQLGRIDIYTVPDVQNLQKQGNSLWGFDKAGAEEVADESSIHQSHLESSNVSPIWITTNLIESNRSFQSYQRAVKAYDTVAEKTNSIGRIG